MKNIDSKGKGCLIKVRVHPHSSKQKILFSKDSEEITIYLKNPAEKNRANKELLKVLGKLFKGSQVSISSGAKSTLKILEIENIDIQTARNTFLKLTT